jgi:hypothetical protein
LAPHDREWTATVLQAYEESLRQARAVCEGRDEFVKRLVQVAKEDGGHKTLAKLFHAMLSIASLTSIR